MGGDGMWALGVAILGAMAIMIASGFGIAFWIGRKLARARGADGRMVLVSGLAAGALGAGIGVLGVIATFFEATWAPPPRIDLAVPPGYGHRWTVIIEDPRAAQSLDWQGSNLPFMQRHAAVRVPPNGIIRVRSLGEALGRGDLELRWSDGAATDSRAMGPAPAAVSPAGYALAFNRAEAGGPVADAPTGDALAALVAARE